MDSRKYAGSEHFDVGVATIIPRGAGIDAPFRVLPRGARPRTPVWI